MTTREAFEKWWSDDTCYSTPEQLAFAAWQAAQAEAYERAAQLFVDPSGDGNSELIDSDDVVAKIRAAAKGER